jgi:hypothetical protein
MAVRKHWPNLRFSGIYCVFSPTRVTCTNKTKRSSKTLKIKRGDLVIQNSVEALVGAKFGCNWYLKLFVPPIRSLAQKQLSFFLHINDIVI